MVTEHFSGSRENKLTEAWFCTDKIREYIDSTYMDGENKSEKRRFDIFMRNDQSSTVGHIEVWKGHTLSEPYKKCAFISFSIDDDWSGFFSTGNNFEDFLSSLRSFILSVPSSDDFRIGMRDMTPYCLPEMEDKRLVLAGSSPDDVPLPHTLAETVRLFREPPVLHPKQESLIRGAPSGERHVLCYDLSNLSDLRYRIILSSKASSFCIIYDSKSRLAGASFHMERTSIPLADSLDIVFAAASIWSDGPFIGNERHSPLFRSFGEMASSADDLQTIPVSINLINTFLVRDSLDSLAKALEGRLVYRLLLNEEDRVVLQAYAANGGVQLALYLGFTEKEKIEWEDVAGTVSQEEIFGQIGAEEKNENKGKSLQEIMANEKRKRRRRQ